MPCYHFTYHAYGSWMPDHRRGFVKRNQGIKATDVDLAALYRGNLLQSTVRFDEAIQGQVIDACVRACAFQEMHLHFVATEMTHVHVLVSWKLDRPWQLVRKQVRSSVTRELNLEIKRQEWFSKSPSRKRVKDRKHFDYLVARYLPSHSGL